MEASRNLTNINKFVYCAVDIKHKTNDIISDNQRYVITLINYTLLCQVISLFGCVSNVINLIIFYNQGLNTTINISFFSLAICDLCSLVMQLLSNIFVNPWFVALNLPMMYGEVQWGSARIARMFFTRNTFFITVYITAERCLCIAFPLRVKQMITPKTILKILMFMYVFTLATFLPGLGTYYIGWKFHRGKNKTLLLGIIYTKYYRLCSATSFFLTAVSGAIAFLVVVVLTLFLILKLREKSDWHKMANVGQEKSQSISQRDKATVRMVVSVTSILIICFTPSVFLSFATFIEPELREDGEYRNLYSSLWSVAMVMENLNSSVNILFYFKMSSRYRQTFGELFSACLCKTNENTTADTATEIWKAVQVLDN